jgi:hypothetical protein
LRGPQIGGAGTVGNASVTLTDFRIEGTYTTGPTVTALNSNSACVIGGSYNITGSGFTGSSAVTINGISASFTVTNDTTISVTIPQMSSYGTVTVQVTNGTSASCNGTITTPTVSAISPTATIGAGQQRTFSTSISGITPTTAEWSASGGSITSGGVWTAPNPPLSHGYTYSINVWPAANTTYDVPSQSLNVSVYNGPASITPSSTSIPYGSTWSISGSYLDSATQVKLGTTDITAYVTGNTSGNIYISGSVPQGTSGTLYVANQYGSTTGATVTIQTVSITSISGTTPQYFSTTQYFSGGVVSGAANTSVTWSVSPNLGSWSGNAWTSPGSGAGWYTITATSVADPTKYSSMSVYVDSKVWTASTSHTAPTTGGTNNKIIYCSNQFDTTTGNLNVARAGAASTFLGETNYGGQGSLSRTYYFYEGSY